MSIEFVLFLLAVGLFLLLSYWGGGRRAARRRARKRLGRDSRPYRETVAAAGAAGDKAGGTAGGTAAMDNTPLRADLTFEKRRVMHRSELQLLSKVEQIATEQGAGHRVMAQISLGELIQPQQLRAPQNTSDAALASIYESRVGLVVLDSTGVVVLVVEALPGYPGQDAVLLRDAVKREALRRAGIPVVEVEQGVALSALRDQMLRHLAEPALKMG